MITGWLGGSSDLISSCSCLVLVLVLCSTSTLVHIILYTYTFLSYIHTRHAIHAHVTLFISYYFLVHSHQCQ